MEEILMVNKKKSSIKCDRYRNTMPYENIDPLAKLILDDIMFCLVYADELQLSNKSTHEFLNKLVPGHPLIEANEITWAKALHTVITELLEQPSHLKPSNSEKAH
tara:strand:- start:1083 stop:1397 length:315 start_codon:yes stop_codon:yes gene_type:complete